MQQASNRQPPVAAVAIIGFGEVGPIFAAALTAQGVRVAAYDVKLDDAATRGQIEERAQRGGLVGGVRHDRTGHALTVRRTSSTRKPFADASRSVG